jgi:hypothetical protein
MTVSFVTLMLDAPTRDGKAVTAAAFETAAAFGLGVEVADDVTYSWDGRGTIRVPTEFVPERIAHEIAHFQMAAPWRRWTPEFGLGPGYVTRAPLRPRVSDTAAYREELMACVLGLLWLRRWGGDVLAEAEDIGILEQRADGAWDVERREADPVTPDQALAYFLRAGFVDPDGWQPSRQLRTGALPRGRGGVR